jgi:hypothetical protein
MAVDGAGNVHVIGWSLRSGDNSDYVTINYDSSGNELWVARYDGPGGSFDRPFGLAVDGAGKVYVTGMSIGSGTDSDYATIKYDPTRE